MLVFPVLTLIRIPGNIAHHLTSATSQPIQLKFPSRLPRADATFPWGDFLGKNEKRSESPENFSEKKQKKCVLKNFPWCRWGQERRVKRAHTRDRGPPSMPAEI